MNKEARKALMVIRRANLHDSSNWLKQCLTSFLLLEAVVSADSRETGPSSLVVVLVSDSVMLPRFVFMVVDATVC